MVQRHWRIAKKTVEDDDAISSGLLHWLCGKWEDHRGSIYEVSLSEKGAVLLCTTRPSGEVMNSNGLIRESAARIVWGRPHQRKVYTLEKADNNTLRWRSSDEHGNSFDWKRQACTSSDDDSAQSEQRSLRGERRAQLRREYRERRESAKAIKYLLGGCMQQEAKRQDEAKQHVLPVETEKEVADKLLEFLTSPPEAEAPPFVSEGTIKDFEQQWHEQQLYQNFYFQLGMWDGMQETLNYFAQTPVPGMPPAVWQQAYIPAHAMQPLGKAA